MNNTKMYFLYQCNDKYAPYCGVSITSLFENNTSADDITIYILDDGISPYNKEKFRRLATQYERNIIFIETDTLNASMQKLGIPKYRGSYTANFKMFINQYIPSDVQRLVYIDSDTIIHGDLTDLFVLNMKEKPIAMAQDSIVRTYKTEIGLAQEDRYYNSGVLLFDVPAWNRKNCSQRIVDHIKAIRAQYAAPDQDLLNLVLRDEILVFPPKYNYEPAYEMFKTETYLRCFKSSCFYTKHELEAAKSDVRIYHFFRVMGEFPWHKNNMHPFNDVFDQYLALSPWADYEKASANISIIFKAEKLLYKILPKCVFIRIFKLSHEVFMHISNQKSLNNKNNNLM